MLGFFGLSPTTATVCLFGYRVTFRVSERDTVRQRKVWTSGGSRLDLASMPAEPEATVEDLVNRLFRGQSVSHLHRVYMHLFWRPTTSMGRNYLIWRIRPAKAGKVPTGTRQRRSSSTGEKVKGLPLCIPQIVDALDQA